MVTYIGGLHSPPVSQPTAIHEDIRLRGRGRDRLSEPLGSLQDRLRHRMLMVQMIHQLLRGFRELVMGNEDRASCPQVATEDDQLGIQRLFCCSMSSGDPNRLLICLKSCLL